MIPMRRRREVSATTPAYFARRGNNSFVKVVTATPISLIQQQDQMEYILPTPLARRADQPKRPSYRTLALILAVVISLVLVVVIVLALELVLLRRR